MMKRILITGTTSGIGKSAGHQLLSQGHQVIMAVRNIEAGKALVKQWQSEFPNSEIDVLYLDLSSFESIISFAKTFNEKYAYLDVLINNAGTFQTKKTYTEEGFEMTLGVNLIGTYLLTRLMLSPLKTSGQAEIINVSSKAGFSGHVPENMEAFKSSSAGFKAYAASKKALLMMTVFYSQQLKDLNIRVNAIHPGNVATNIFSGNSLMMKLVRFFANKNQVTPEVGAQPIIDLIENGNEFSGNFVQKNNELIALPHQIKDENHMFELMQILDDIVEPYI